MKRYRTFIRTLWWVYIAWLLIFVVVKFRGSFTELRDRMALPQQFAHYNLIPFATIRVQLRFISRGWAWFNLLGNTVSFVPFGFLLPLVCEKIDRLWKVLLAGVVTVALIELFQYFTRLGSLDVDDLILNMAGIAFGYFLMWYITRRGGQETQ